MTVLDSLHPYYDHRIKEYTLDKHRAIADAEGSAYEFVEGDVRNECLIGALVSQADVAFHFH